MLSFHTLAVGNRFYLRESSQQVKRCKGLCIGSTSQTVSSKEELPKCCCTLQPLGFPQHAQKSTWHSSTQITWEGQYAITEVGKVPGLGNLQTKGITSSSYLLPLSFPKTLLLDPPISAFIFTFLMPGFHLCLLQLWFLSFLWSFPPPPCPACLVLIP